MASSTHQAFIRFDTTHAGANLPVDTAQSKDGLVSNALHAYDEHFAHRANWMTEASATKFFNPVGLSSTVPQYTHRILFPLTIKADGRSAPLVIRLFGRVDTASTTVTWYLALRSLLAAVDEPTGSHPWETTASHTSTTAAWADTAASTIALPASAIFDSSFPTKDALAGSLVTTRVVMARLDIYATTSGAGEGELWGFHVREYVGT